MSTLTTQQAMDSPARVEPGLAKHLITLRRWFHQHPELSFQEQETAAHIMQE